jgi:curved DNA-binding protein
VEYKDYYKIMGVEKTASEEDIKRAYRKLARKYHPDVSKETNAEAHFKEINEAYEVLKDPEKRQSYDQLGSNWKSGASSQGGGFNPQDFGRGQGGYGGAHAGEFSDFFEQFFGGGGGRRAGGQQARARAGEDLQTEISVSLEEVYQGVSKTIQYECPVIENGYEHRVAKAIKVKIPTGVVDGQQIRLTGQGGAGTNGAKAGDLYLKIKMQPHALYTVAGHDLTMVVPIAPWEAALGATIQVPTLAGHVEVKIPVGARSGAKMRLKGRGLTGKVTGDQYLLLQIQVPIATSPQQKALYEQMASLFSFDERQHF